MRLKKNNKKTKKKKKQEIRWPQACVSCGKTGSDLKKHSKKSRALVSLSAKIETTIHAYLCRECTEDSKLIKTHCSEKVFERKVLRNLILLVFVPIALIVLGIYMANDIGIGLAVVVFMTYFLLGVAWVLPDIYSRVMHRRDLISPFIQLNYSMFGIKEKPYFVVRNLVFHTIFSSHNPGIKIILDSYLEDKRSML